MTERFGVAVICPTVAQQQRIHRADVFTSSPTGEASPTSPPAKTNDILQTNVAGDFFLSRLRNEPTSNLELPPLHFRRTTIFIERFDPAPLAFFFPTSSTTTIPPPRCPGQVRRRNFARSGGVGRRRGFINSMIGFKKNVNRATTTVMMKTGSSANIRPCSRHRVF